MVGETTVMTSAEFNAETGLMFAVVEGRPYVLGAHDLSIAGAAVVSLLAAARVVTPAMAPQLLHDCPGRSAG
jgi:hypothetical protein